MKYLTLILAIGTVAAATPASAQDMLVNAVAHAPAAAHAVGTDVAWDARFNDDAGTAGAVDDAVIARTADAVHEGGAPTPIVPAAYRLADGVPAARR